MCLGWWLFSGNGPGGPPGNAQRYAVPDAEATGPAGTAAAPTTPPARVPGTVPIDAYALVERDLVEIDYRSRPVRCVGRLDTPAVVETDAAVTVTLTHVRPSTPAPRRCRGLVPQEHYVRVDLDAPLEGRSLLDGSGTQPVRVEESPAADR